ncbi:CHAT domain-containing protein [Dendronalium sp. ChiSLP03b]|uniref:CHAT domain-containing protein n=1 Tax=Dendronalium sp. ChiSLP03b TaxID=3075381 RepID=UPI002AD3EF69|nr:CHAT domain-containing protein [Dendronalium sp. ChiSLP03b]MDZ8203546.1 CHAT domain-containing protein [Dendronalium sp. ChiSLP03b]
MSQPSFMLAQVVSKQTQHQKAQILTQKGHELLNQGQATEAYEAWKQALKIYRQLNLAEGVTGNLINQNLALQALGLYPRACKTTLEALKMDMWICDPSSNQPDEFTEERLKVAIQKVAPTPINLLALHNLGDALRLIGKLNESVVVLEKTLSLVHQVTPEKDASGIKLSLVVSEQYIYERARDRYYWISEPAFKKETVNFIKKQALKLLNDHQLLIDTPSISIAIKLQSQLQRLSLLLDFSKWLASESNSGNRQLVTIQPQINQQIQPSVEGILKNSSVFSELPASQSIYAKLNFAESLNQISNEQLHSLAIQYATSALHTAKSTDNKRLQSESFGTLGKLEKQATRKQAHLEQAMTLAQSIQAWDIAYHWQQQLGGLYKKQGKYQQALEAYSAAINNLTQVRDNLLASNVDLQFSFYEKVEPVYREYMRLLLLSPNPNLEKVIQTNQQLQIAELENFLRCGKLDLVPLNNLQKLPSTAAIVHVIDLGSSIEVIVQSPDRSLHYNSVDAQLIRSYVNNLLDILQSLRFSSSNDIDIISHSQKLYNLLIAPLKTYLDSSGTLVFALDASFQSLPMGLLHDGKDYLVNQYSIAESVGSKVQPPLSLSKKQLTALIAGLSKESPSFYDENAPKGLTALPGVAIEIADVKKETTSSRVLLNEKFTSLQFQKELTKNDFPIVHISTHGQFSSNSDKTVFLAYDKAINILEFDSLLKNKVQQNENAIELLVLSACRTAKGNKRSILGIAGVAAQAGAQSIIASLWLVDDESTALLMQKFYEGLKNRLTKAEALRQAQLSLSSNSRYKHPYFWAGFVLVGGWL